MPTIYNIGGYGSFSFGNLGLGDPTILSWSRQLPGISFSSGKFGHHGPHDTLDAPNTLSLASLSHSGRSGIRLPNVSLLELSLCAKMEPRPFGKSNRQPVL